MRFISSFLIAFCLGILFTTSAQAAGFDCNKALSTDEKIVCGDTQLSHLDDVFNARYGAARKTYPDDDIVHSARNFLADRHDCGGDRACILSAYLAILWEVSTNKNSFMQGISAKSLTGGKQPGTSDIPTKAGQCAATSILAVHPRVESGDAPLTDEDFNNGTGIDYANDSYQVSYNREEMLIRSKPGDPVTQCLVEIDRDCEPDESGRLFLVTNGRTRESWILPDAQHKCGG
jgi:uncharacterized protein